MTTWFRIYYEDGSSNIVDMAQGITLDQARDYYIGKYFEFTENKPPVKATSVSRDFGFFVLPEERKSEINLALGDKEDENGTLFVDVSGWPHNLYPDKVIANLFYARNNAKWNPTTEEELKCRFPKSFKLGEAAEEYRKSFPIEYFQSGGDR